MSNLSELICGSVSANYEGELAQILWHFSETINLLEPYLRRQDPQPVEQWVIPFLVKSMMEVACTSLIARLDPFRILTLARIQGDAEYDFSKKVTSAIQWRGDVLSDKNVTNLWDASRKSTDMTRALLGDYQEQILWQPAFLKLLDYFQQIEEPNDNEWLAELVNTDPVRLVPRFRETAGKIYSQASKGIHHEFVRPGLSYYDNDTLVQLTEEAIRLVSNMALIINFAETITYGLTGRQAISHYKAV